MKLNREIMRVKAMIEREQNLGRLVQLTNLLISLQNEYIQLLEKQNTNVKRKVA